MSEESNVNQATSVARAMNVVTKVCIATFVLAVVVTIAFFSWWALKDRLVFGHDKFNQVVWMTAPADTQNLCKRGDMAFDLQQTILLPGMPLEQATVLLGRPSWDDGNQIEYDLGKCLQVEHGLRLFFNDKNQLTHSRITQH